MKEPDLTKVRRNCDCKTGRLSKLLAYSSESRFKKRTTHQWCTFKCINCGARWKVEVWLRGKGWTDLKWTKTQAGKRA